MLAERPREREWLRVRKKETGKNKRETAKLSSFIQKCKKKINCETFGKKIIHKNKPFEFHLNTLKCLILIDFSTLALSYTQMENVGNFFPSCKHSWQWVFAVSLHKIMWVAYFHLFEFFYNSVFKYLLQMKIKTKIEKIHLRKVYNS